MRIVVVGGTGRIGSALVAALRERGHEAVPASPDTGVNALTGEGVAEAVAGADVVVDVANAPVWRDEEVLHFFETTSRTLLAAEKAAGVRHHVALSIVGADRVPDSGYLRAKVAQEREVEAGGVPWTVVRSTQFFEFLRGIGDNAEREGRLHLSPGLLQPIAAADVVELLADAVTGEPLGRIEIGGPKAQPLDELVAAVLRREGDSREIVVDPQAGYFGAVITDQLVPGPGARLGRTGFEEWLG